MKLQTNEIHETFSDMLENRAIQTVFQPIVSLQDGSLYGFEALTRGPVNTPLQNPEYLFNYAMEQDQLWDLEYLCRTKALESAHELELKGKLFLNVNPNIMSDEKFRQGFTKEYLSKYAIDPETIVFEITEKEAASSTDFVGHIGGDDFIMVIPAGNCIQYCEQIISKFDASIKHFYRKQDLEKGFIHAQNRHGESEQFPLLTISIAGITNHSFQSTFELAESASSLKKQCKQLSGSNYLFSNPLTTFVHA